MSDLWDVVLSYSLQVSMHSYFYCEFLYHVSGNHLFLTHSFYIYELNIFLFYTCSTRLLYFLKSVFRTPLYMSQQGENIAICMEFHLLDHFSGKELFKILRYCYLQTRSWSSTLSFRPLNCASPKVLMRTKFWNICPIILRSGILSII